MLQIKAMSQKARSWSMSFNIGSWGKCATWGKIFCCRYVFGFFPKQRLGSRAQESRLMCLGLMFSPRLRIILLVDWMNIYGSHPECQALCSAEDAAGSTCSHGSPKVRDQGNHFTEFTTQTPSVNIQPCLCTIRQKNFPSVELHGTSQGSRCHHLNK